MNFKDLLNFREKSNANLKISIKEKISLLEQISSLLNSWIPITNSLNIILLQSRNPNIKIMVSYLLDQVNKWVHLKDSFRQFKKVVTNFDASIIEMWEMTWKLGESIDVIREKEEKNHSINTKIKWALTYPIIIILLSLWMILVFLIYVIPKIKDMYSDAKVNLPWLTQAVIDISNFLKENVIWLVIGLVFIVVWFIVFKNHDRTKIIYDKYILRVPIFGPLIKTKILAIFSRTLWTLLKSWVLINKSLEISKSTLDNRYYEKELEDIILWVSKWTQLSDLMWIWALEDLDTKENEYFPIELASIVKIWEQTWNLPSLLLRISQKFNNEVDNTVKNLSTAIEPIVILVVWIIIWTLIMAIMLPFFNMVNVI